MGKKLKDWGLFCFILCLMCTIIKVPIHAADGPNADPTYSCAFIGIGTVNSEDSNAVDEMQYLYNVRQPESEITMISQQIQLPCRIMMERIKQL
jgi:hypothetical protein